MSRGLSLAGFQVTLIGRFWVTPEAFVSTLSLPPTRILGNGHVDFPHGPVKLARCSRQVQSIRKQQALQRRCMDPHVFQRADVIRFELDTFRTYYEPA